jgi:catechol 2,3-dioxygenase-like lactoylglutathione lyase family enzyme
MSQSIVRFQRANFVVHDLERALGLYRDILGFEVEYIQDSPADSYSYVAFEIDHKAKLRFATLSTPGQQRVMALTEVKGVPLKHCPDPKRAAIVLEVGDFDYVCERAVAWGLIVHPEERLVTHDGRTGREAGILDHDGNLVVIYTINEKAG